MNSQQYSNYYGAGEHVQRARAAPAVWLVGGFMTHDRHEYLTESPMAIFTRKLQPDHSLQNIHPNIRCKLVKHKHKQHMVVKFDVT